MKDIIDKILDCGCILRITISNFDGKTAIIDSIQINSCDKHPFSDDYEIVRDE
jgi:hypothetical protein